MSEFQKVGSVGDFSDGEIRVFAVDGVDVSVVTHNGRFHAFSGRCPHAGSDFNHATIREGDRILCQSHLAWFLLETGEVLDGPTSRGLDLYPVKVEGDEVLVCPEPEAP